MPNLLTVSSVMMCPHGGQVQAVSSNARAKAARDFLLRPSDTFTIIGCPFNIAGAPHPCVQAQWVMPDLQSKAAGDFTLNEASVGLCLAADMAPQGTVLIQWAQAKVSGR